MPTLLPSLDLREPLVHAAQTGTSFIAEALDDTARTSLQTEIAGGPFEQLPDQIGPYGVREKAELLQIATSDLSRYPATARLLNEFVRLVHAHGTDINGIGDWQPNDIAAMRYPADSFGITPHRDNKRFRSLIAIFTIAGTASFTLCADRDGTVIDRWQTIPNSLVLMRAPGLAGAEDGRPFHTVSGPIGGDRISLTFRMSADT